MFKIHNIMYFLLWLQKSFHTQQQSGLREKLFFVFNGFILGQKGDVILPLSIPLLEDNHGLEEVQT